MRAPSRATAVDPRWSAIDARSVVTDVRLAVTRPQSVVLAAPPSFAGAGEPEGSVPGAGPTQGRRLSDLLRPHLDDAVEEIERQVRAHGAEAAQPLDEEYVRLVRQVIRETVAHFVDSLGRDEPGGHGGPDGHGGHGGHGGDGGIGSAGPVGRRRYGQGEQEAARLAALYDELGAEAARRGRSLDLLQTALRLSSQVACRRFIKDAYRFDWPKETLARLTDRLFELLARAAEAGAQGYARQQGHMASDRERRRIGLRDLLVREPAPTPDALAERAKAAEWKVPAAVAVVALRPAARQATRILPPDVLVDWDAATPYLIVPDPEAPGRREELPALLLRLGVAAIGPTVVPVRAATSLRWARHTIALVERGVLAADRPVRAADHTALLAAALAEDLIDTAAARLLAPMLALPARRRTPLLLTLLTYLQCGDNAVLTAGRLHIHEQTVRYRLRRITELTGRPGCEPADRLDLMLVLTWLLHRGDRGDRGDRPDRQQRSRTPAGPRLGHRTGGAISGR
ncbi:putative transcriptional regulator, PucR family [Actinobacteria bacterium OK074]|nr:putative transcriptional regulator, PucR family [Actinobacteria bacterium OK074]